MPFQAVVKRCLPGWLKPYARAIYYPLFRIGLRVWCWGHRVRDWGVVDKPEDMPVPPPMFRFKVGGTPSRTVFLETGRACAASIVQVIHDMGHPFSDAWPGRILDFGCGCGRTLLWLSRQFPSLRYSGTDTDAEMIDWCSRNLGFATFSVNGQYPPLPRSRQELDLIYAVSVFTHLDETTQLRWLVEFARLLKPGGFLFLTVHGEAVWSGLSPDQQEKIRQHGTVMLASQKLKGIFPDWYQTSFHTESYMKATCSRYFDHVSYIPEGMGYLDVIVCRKTGSDGPDCG